MRLLTIVSVLVLAAQAAEARGTFINMDAWCFWHGSWEEMNAESIRKDVDFYTAGGGVEALIFNMNFQRTFFETKAWTPYWKDLAIDADGDITLRGAKMKNSHGQTLHKANDYKQMFENVEKMRKNCPNYMKVRYDCCHEKGVECWWSMRMNDVHWTNPGNEERPQHGDMWYRNKERVTRAWYRRPWFPEWHWENYALDYGQEEIFEYNLALLREYLLDYECDGLELDFLRAIPVFKPGFDELNTPILTRFVREVKKTALQAAAKWGHRVRIGVRVPTRVQDAYDCGMDVPAWGDEGLVDIVVPSPKSVRMEQDCQVRLWRRVLPKNVEVHPALDMYTCAGWMVRPDLSIDCGFASTYWYEGADSVYVYNHFYQFWKMDAPQHAYKDMQKIYALAGDRAAVERQKRRHLVTCRETAVDGQYAESPFPGSVAAGSAAAMRINLGGATKGRKAMFYLGLDGKDAAGLEIWLNGVCCGEVKPTADLPGRVPQHEERIRYFTVVIPDGVAHDGWNVIDLHNASKETLVRDSIAWMEICLDEVRQ